MLKKKSEEIFGADNWLTEELQRESRISAWDMDDSGRQLRQEHERDCDARNLAAMHALDCAAEENAAIHRREHQAEISDPGFLRALGRNVTEGSESRGNKNKAVTAVVAMMLIMAAIAAAPFLAGLLPLILIGFALSAVRQNKR